MSFKLKQGRKEFSKTGRGITSKLAGPDDPITYPSKKNIMYSGKGNEYQYTSKLRDSLKNAGLPTGNLFERGRKAQRAIAYGKDNPTKQEYETAEKIGTLINHTKYRTDPRRINDGEDYRYSTRLKGITERMLMNIEGQINERKKKKKK